MAKIYSFDKDHTGMRLTDCCGAFSSYSMDSGLYCKVCFETVGFGQGDGEEYVATVDPLANATITFEVTS
jgi:hypothetical protein